LVSTIIAVVTMLMLPANAMPTGGSQSYVNTRSPHGNLNIACQNCHTVEGWKPIRAVPEFDHNQTRYPLRGLHQGVTCTQCHTKPVFTNVGTKCADCHADIHKRQFGASCEQCHSVKGWQVSLAQIKNHDNRFPLVGAHRTLECDSCHKGAAVGQFQGLSTQCYSCHANDYKATTGPSHVQTGFPVACEQCHSADTWFGAAFDHLKFTGFALTGAHTTLDCNACHVGGKYKGTPANCVGCHLKDFQGTKNPNHVQANFPQTCQGCHNTSAWQPANFDHSLIGFPLTGAHATLQCSQCHINNNYNLTSTQCVSCHLKDYQGTTDPNHVQANFPTTCQNCHSTVNWLGATFDHASTGFALTGTHKTLQCSQCHVNGNYKLTSGACVNCHLKDYQGTTNPNHVSGGFPTTCDSCHSTINWLGATFNHSSTGFPLTGFHATVPCAQCHVNNNYNLTSTACVTCHLNDFNATTAPNHTQVGFPQQCQVCHNTTAWIPSSFNHNNTTFPLTGFHTTVPCAQCHVNNNYLTLPTACVGCHQADYNGTTNPNHIAAGFPTTCQTCHNTSSWLGAVFNHTYFPIPHNGINTCSNCHTNPSNYLVFSCINCHTHDKPTTDAQHQGVGGYVYNSANCYQCHRNGQGGG